MFDTRRFRHGSAAAVTAALVTACSSGPSPLLPVAGTAPARTFAIHETPRITVPFFTKSFTYGSKTYTLKMVGSDPALGNTTVISDQVIPISLTFPDGTVLNGANEVNTLLASPVFVDANYASGTTQFSDNLMRSEFWTYAANSNYHVLLGPPSVEPTVRVTVPPGDGSIVQGQGRVTYQWFVQTIEPQVLQQLNIDPTTLSIFLTEKIEVLEPKGFCCYGGYHSSFNLTSSFGPATYTTAWSSVRRGAVVGVAHEVSEWMNDPFYTNVVPKWVAPTGSKCAGNKLEVGDPLAGVIYKINGYEVSDMTFYSWFVQDAPSIGINGQYDVLGRLTGPAFLCT
jgi:hypothetical protein